MRARSVLMIVALAALVGGFVLPTPAEATNGYFMHGTGTKSKALAGAGVAFPQDSLAPASNPAGLAFVGKRYDAGLAIFNPARKYTINGASLCGPPQCFPLVPGTVDSDSEYFPVPHFGGSWEMGNAAVFGISVYGQGGMNTDYPTATFYDPTSSSTGVNLNQLFVLPTFAKAFGDGKHALGLSPIIAYQQFEAEGVLSFGQFSSDPSRLSGTGGDDGTGFGFKIGYLGKFTDAFSFGASYQSKIGMDEFSKYAGLFAEQGGFDIPSTWTAGIAINTGENGVFLLDYQEIKYSDTASVSNPFANLFNLFGPVADPRPFLLGGDQGPGFGWQDMEVIKVGYQWGSGDWTWRVGASTTEQPIPQSEVLFNILAPGVMEEHYTFGFTKAMASGNELNFSLMHAPSVTVSGPNPLDFSGQQSIDLHMSQWDIELGYSWGF